MQSEVVESVAQGRLSDEYELMDWHRYHQYFTEEAPVGDRLTPADARLSWAREIAAARHGEVVKRNRLNRKTGLMELRDHLYVETRMKMSKEHIQAHRKQAAMVETRSNATEQAGLGAAGGPPELCYWCLSHLSHASFVCVWHVAAANVCAHGALHCMSSHEDMRHETCNSLLFNR